MKLMMALPLAGGDKKIGDMVSTFEKTVKSGRETEEEEEEQEVEEENKTHEKDEDCAACKSSNEKKLPMSRNADDEVSYMHTSYIRAALIWRRLSFTVDVFDHG